MSPRSYKKRFLRLSPMYRKRPSVPQSNRILIYRIGSLGDTLVALPCLHLIARTFAGSERILLTNVPIHAKAPAAASVFGAQPPPPSSAAPSTVQWPGPSARTAISVSSESGPPSVLERIGPWSLFRMLEAGSLTAKGETASASFIVAGNELNYEISTGSVRNPLNLATLREFRCPSGI